jgi:hypothetical protein
MSEWENKCEMIYLFANDSVLDFYPKFGFVPTCEYEYSIMIKSNNETSNAEKLDMSLEHNRVIVEKSVENTVANANLSMIGNPGLIMFYLTSFMSNNVYYMRELETIVVADFKKDTLYVHDIFSEKEVDVNTVIDFLANKSINKVILGFTPKNEECFDVNLLSKEDTTLFVLNEKSGLFKNNKIMFPILSHA